MPAYAFRKTFTAGKSATDTETETLNLVPGIMHNISIAFPIGCSGLVYTRILQVQRNIFPINPTGSYAYDDHVLLIGSVWALEEGNSILTWEGWNTDDTYTHTLTLAFDVSPVEEVFPWLNAEAAMLAILERQHKLYELMGVEE